MKVRLKMKKVTGKRAKLERNRYSVFTDNLSYCYVCGKPRTELHEILFGSNRFNSMKYGYILPLCRKCHESFHRNRILTKKWSVKCQDHFEKKYSVKEWMETFHKNYKD